MPTSPILLYSHIEQGQGQKEVFSNEADDTLERKLCNQEDIDAAGTGDLDLTDDQVRDMSLRFTGVLTGDRTVTVPARNMLYLVENATTGAFTMDFEVIGGAGTAVELGRGFKTWIFCDGVNCIDLTRQLNDYVVDVSGTYQVTEYDRVINADTSGGAFTITLPQAVPGKKLTIISVGASTTLTIARGGTDTMNGSASNLTITTQWQAIQFIGESATNWVAHRLTVA